jgi:hypothetical protein
MLERIIMNLQFFEEKLVNYDLKIGFVNKALDRGGNLIFFIQNDILRKPRPNCELFVLVLGGLQNCHKLS